MPTEMIYGSNIAGVDITDPENPKPLPQLHTRLDVHWRKDYDRCVSVNAVSFTDPGVDLVSSEPVELDRAAVNKLIRDLRRARAQVFGADE